MVPEDVNPGRFSGILRSKRDRKGNKGGGGGGEKDWGWSSREAVSPFAGFKHWGGERKTKGGGEKGRVPKKKKKKKTEQGLFLGVSSVITSAGEKAKKKRMRR